MTENTDLIAPVITAAGVVVTPEAVKPVKPKRASYRFTLKFPAAFTIPQLQNIKNGAMQYKYITIYKRIEAALKTGQIGMTHFSVLTGDRQGRPAKVYVRANIKNAQLAVKKAFPKDQLVVS